MRQEGLVKPQGSLGRLEALVVALAGMQRRPVPEVRPAAILVFTAAHGLAAPGCPEGGAGHGRAAEASP